MKNKLIKCLSFYDVKQEKVDEILLEIKDEQIEPFINYLLNEPILKVIERLIEMRIIEHDRD